jgi:hypothetical protein
VTVSGVDAASRSVGVGKARGRIARGPGAGVGGTLFDHGGDRVLGEKLSFDDAWLRRQTVRCGTADVALPSIDDLITTKRRSMREKDVVDIQLIEALRREKP